MDLDGHLARSRQVAKHAMKETVRSHFRTLLPPTLATLSCHMSPRKQEARGWLGLG